MENKPTTKSTWQTILTIAGVACCFTLLSLALLFRQVHNNLEPIAGQITAVSGNEITIEDKGGKETVLMLTAQTRMHGPLSDPAPGMFVQSFGTKLPDNTFRSKEIRLFETQ